MQIHKSSRWLWPNKLAGVGAGRTPEFIEMMQAGVSHKSGSWGVRLQMTRRVYIITTAVAFALAILATVIGWSQTFNCYANSPQIPTLYWFPLVLAVRPNNDMLLIVLSLIQFPLFATLFVLGVRRWATASVLLVLAFIYTLLVVIACMVVSKDAAQPNHFAGVGAGRTPEFIGINRAGASHKSGSARLAGRWATVSE